MKGIKGKLIKGFLVVKLLCCIRITKPSTKIIIKPCAKKLAIKYKMYYHIIHQIKVMYTNFDCHFLLISCVSKVVICTEICQQVNVGY